MSDIARHLRVAPARTILLLVLLGGCAVATDIEPSIADGDEAQLVAVQPGVSRGPTVGLSSTTVSFAAFAGLTAPPPQIIRIDNAGHGALRRLHVDVGYADAAESWLSATLDETTAPAQLTLRPTSTSLAAGIHTATVSVHAQRLSADAQTVQVHYELKVATAPVIVTDSVLPYGIAAAPYSLQLEATGGDGTYSWSIVSSDFASFLNPPALSPSGALTRLPDPPLSPGMIFHFVARVESAHLSVTQGFALQIYDDPFLDDWQPRAIAMGRARTVVLYGDSRLPTPAVYSLSSGQWPPGMSLGPNVLGGRVPGLAGFGTVVGTASAVGTFTATVGMTALSYTSLRTIQILVYPPIAFSSGSPLAPAWVGMAYSADMTVSGGIPGAGTTATALIGGALPSGLSYDGSSVSGTPTASGHSTFMLRAMYHSPEYYSDVDTLVQTFTIDVFDPLTVVTTTLPAAAVGTTYSAQLVAGGGDAAHRTWSVQGGATLLPPGIQLSADGALSGTPTVAGTFPFTVLVTSAGRTATASLSIYVAP